MLTRYIGRDSHKLPLIAPGLKYNKEPACECV
jgi:hypothetical protein